MPISPLAVGFLVEDKNEWPAWEYDMLIELLMEDFISKVVIVVLGRSLSEKKPNSPDSFLFRLFTYFESRWFRKQPDASSSKEVNGLEETFKKLSFFEIIGEKKPILNELDLIYVCYKLKPLPFLKIPRFGIWYIEFGDKPNVKSSIPAFWEVMLNEVVTKATLFFIIDGEKYPFPAYKSVSVTVPFSVKNNFNSVAWKASRFLVSRLRQIYITGFDQFLCNNEIPDIENELLRDRVNVVKPSNLHMVRFLIRNIYRYLTYKVKNKVFKSRFIILYSMQKYCHHALNIEEFIPLKPPGKNFWADPFVLKNNDDHFVFFEEGVYPLYKGRIAALKINKDRKIGESHVILERSYHLSYPFIFEVDGSYYMIPESSANRTVDLYQCKNFPYEWEFSKSLLQNIYLQDSTVFYYNNTWWLFATTKYPKSCTSNDLLMIYHCQDIFSGEWKSHAGNPVVTDVSNCRPAGSIYMNGGKIFRPAQNNASSQYGFSIRINEIEKLTTTEYKERLVDEISPNVYRNFKAVHTFNSCPEMIVIDGILS